MPRTPNQEPKRPRNVAGAEKARKGPEKAEKAPNQEPKRPRNVASTFFSTVNLLPKHLGFEYGGA